MNECAPELGQYIVQLVGFEQTELSILEPVLCSQVRDEELILFISIQFFLGARAEQV